ncbi:hypothetical protein AgCh_021078 [Apium graveolens]
MDEKEESEDITKWDCHLNSCLYDTYDVVAIGNQLDSFIMKFPFFGSSRRLSSLSTTSNAVSASASAEFPAMMISMSEKSKISIKVRSVVVKVWSKIVSKYVRKKTLKDEVKDGLKMKKCNKANEELKKSGTQ